MNQDLVLNTSSAMSKYGLLAVGYEYVNIDDCWSSVRDPSNQTIIPDYTKFPNGMAYIADQLHAEGFKFGMYSDAGNKTVSCSSNPPSTPFGDRSLISSNLTVCWLPRQLRLRKGRRRYLCKLGSGLLEV